MTKSVIMHALMSFMLHGYETPPTPPTTTPTPPATTPTPPTGCYEGYGCFPVDGIWGGPERPVSLHPLPPLNVTPTFCLYTPARPHCLVVNAQDPSTNGDLSLNSLTSLFVITHGYLESTQLAWVREMVGALLATGGRVGVMTVDWYKAAPPTYAQAVANIRLVGVMVGRLLALMADNGVGAADMHLIGHSLGGHLMAYAATSFNETTGLKVGRITALDPAGPYFTNTPPDVRLDPSDATFVDVIHTDIPTNPWDINRLGYADPLGHLDFYPNGGHQQAGCQGSAASHIDREETVAGGVLSYIGCSHQRSHHFFTESITSPQCRFMGVECASWEEYKAGACWGCGEGGCVAMGYPARPPKQGHSDSSPALPPRRIYFGTNPEHPFCAEQYRVTLETAGRTGQGDLAHFTVTLRGHLRTLTLPAPPSATWVEAGGRLQWAGWGRGDLGRLYNLQVEYEDDQDLLQALVWRFQPSILTVDSFTVEELSTGITVRFPFCGGKMQAGQSYTLLPNASCS